MQGRDGTPRTQTFEFKADGATLTGTVSGMQGEPTPIQNGKVDGDNISFEVTRSRGGNSFTRSTRAKSAPTRSFSPWACLTAKPAR